MRTMLLATAGLILAAGPVLAQDRDTRVRNDRQAHQEAKDWIYNDLDQGVESAKSSGKPILVVFRCIPCEACQEFDDDVARKDPIIRDLLEEFVCVRIVQANTINLARFQYDFDQSFAIVLMSADGTIYGRFGTRSDRPEFEDISLQGLRKAMAAALEIHANLDQTRPSLEGKQPRPTRYKTPLDYPSLASRFEAKLDYEGQVAKSCMHCHQVGEAQRRVYRDAGEPIPDGVLYPYPDPAVLGLKMDPREMATVEELASGSSADRAGLRVGDAIVSLAGQPLLSIADLQWVLNTSPATADLPARVRRDGEAKDLTIRLNEGWRRGNLSWRATSWDLRRMGLGGMKLDEVAEEERKAGGLTRDGMALRVKHVAQFGDHANAKRAGFLPGDTIVAFDDRDGRMTESDLLAYTLQRKRPGDEVEVTILRGGERKTLTLPLK